MALNNIVTTVILDVYDHDTTPSTFKAIALDSKTRYVLASLRYRGAIYDIGENAGVTLTVLRPDGTGVQVTGQTYQIIEPTPEGGEVTIYGAYAELTQLALAIKGNCKAQFKLTSGEQILRTEIFSINNGQALDADIEEWAGDLDGHNLDEMAESIETLETSVGTLQTDVSGVKEDLTQINNLVINQPYGDELRFFIGGIGANAGKTNTMTNRLRMTYTHVIPSDTYRFEITGNNNYIAMLVHFYSAASDSTWLGNPLDVQGKSCVFTIPEGANYIRIVFKDSTDDSRTMEDADVTALASAFHLYQTEPSKKERTGEFIRFTVKDNHRWADNSSTTADDAESSVEVDHLCILTLPESYMPTGEKTPLIMYCHGASCTITENSWYGNSTSEGDGANFMAMIRRFTSEGYAVFDVDNTRHASGGFNDWGSLPLMSAYVKAWEYIRANYNVEDDLYILSASMGTPAAQNMMKWYKGHIKAALILAPRPFGIKGRWDETYGEITDAKKKELLVAWGIEDDEILTDETFVVPSKADVFTAAADARFRGFYHYENLTAVGGVNYIFEKFPPMKVMVGLNDTSFLPEVRAYYSALQNFGNFVNYREVAGKSHGAMCTLYGGELLDEGVAWFKRFRYTDEGVTA